MLLRERMFLRQEGDKCDVCGGTVGSCSHKPESKRFITYAGSRLRVPGYHEFESVAYYEKPFVPVAADFVIDFDNVDLQDVVDAYRMLSEYVERPLLYHSGSKGFHIVVPARVLKLPKSPYWQQVYETFVLGLGIPADTSVYKHRALIRIPGSVHPRTGYRKRLLNPAEIRRYREHSHEARYNVGNAERLRNVLIGLHEEKAWTEKGDKAVAQHPTENVYLQLARIGVPMCVEALYDHGIPAPGTRNKVYHILASYYRSIGKDLESAKKLMEAFAEMHGSNTKTGTEERVRLAQQTLLSVYRHQHKFSCSEVKEVGLCNTSCRLYQES